MIGSMNLPASQVRYPERCTAHIRTISELTLDPLISDWPAWAMHSEEAY